MENFSKLFGIIALVAVIGFLMTGCFSLGGRSVVIEDAETWPSNVVWGKYNLTGLLQPLETTVTVQNYRGNFTVTLKGGEGKEAFEYLVGQVGRMSGWTVRERKADSVTFINIDADRILIISTYSTNYGTNGTILMTS